MSLIVRFYNIQWDVNCPDCTGIEGGRRVELPSEYVMEFDDHNICEQDWLDALSNTIGWCVNSCAIEWVE